MKGKIKLERASSNRSHCKECGKAIPINEYRVLEIYTSRFQVKDKYCSTCGIELIKECLKELNEMLTEIKSAALDKIKKGRSKSVKNT